MARKMLKDGEVADAVAADGSEESYDYDLFVIGSSARAAAASAAPAPPRASEPRFAIAPPRTHPSHAFVLHPVVCRLYMAVEC